MAAVATETTLVDVVALVTGDAVGLQTNFFLHRLSVAGVAVQIPMSAGEGVVGLATVIEGPQTPVGGVVALGAVTAQTPAVGPCIVAPVATYAGAGSALEFGAQVTGLTRHDPMYPQEREVGEVVVETHIHDPGPATVAVTATLALLTAVAVVPLVTRETVTRQRLVQGTTMALSAGEGTVGAFQRVVGVAPVVEGGTHPGLGQMAFLAGLAVETVVGVLPLVTSAAGDFARGTHVVPVAGSTGNHGVATFQGIVGVTVVVEIGPAPLVLTVAVLASLAVGAAVHVVEVVAGIAGLGGAGVTGIGMAAFAVGLHMSPL